DSVLTAAVCTVGIEYVRVRRVADDRTPERNLHVAAARTQRERLRVVVRGTWRADDDDVAQAPRAGTVHGRQSDDPADQRQSAAEGVRSRRVVWDRSQVRAD